MGKMQFEPKRSKMFALFSLLALTGMSFGCAGPKLVAQITGTKDQAKFLYAQGNSQGVIKCAKASDGKLSDCKELKVNLND